MGIWMEKRVQFGLAVAAAVLSFVGSWSAAARDTQRHLLSPDEAQRWRAVGSLRVAGQPSCTAALISDVEAITAAHCVVDRASGLRVDPEYLALVLGQRADGFAAVRKVVAVAFLPGFLSTEPVTGLAELSSDLALLRLSGSVSAQEATPFEVADWPEPIDAMVDIVGYERGGSKTATIRQGCLSIDTWDGVTTVTCDLITGLSGSPVVLSQSPDSPLRLVASVSARGIGVGYVVTIAPHLAELRALIAKPYGAHGGAPRQ